MDPVRNPYAPGAGTPPPELAGRSELLGAASTALRRVAAGKPHQSLILVGLRGVGKTVLLNRIDSMATAEGFKSVVIEAHEGKSLPELLVPSLRAILLGLSAIENAKEKARHGLRVLRGFVSSIKMKVGDLDLGLSIEPEKGVADSGDLEADIPELIVTIGEAAKAAGKPIAVLIDELQYLGEKEFSAIIMAIHKTNQRSLPLILVGAGLPQIHALAGNSKSYSERLFRFPEIGALGVDEATQAIQKPAQSEGASFTPGAITKILTMTERYPYFLQQWAYEAWNASESETIDETVVITASAKAISELDASFFKVRFDRCTPSEKKYMRALAEFGSGKHRSGDIAERLGVRVNSVAPTRSALIKKGMIYSPSHGDTAFTVPLFDQYMNRAMPISALSETDDDN